MSKTIEKPTGATEEKKKGFMGFPAVYWVSIFFEFIERGSYYGVMSFFSVYLIEELGFSKMEVGWIKSTIQPLLYLLPILTGAIADRKGYRKTLMVAFSLLGIGYFLTSQSTEFLPVFASLVIMGLGAGTFKPIISGTIAKVTDESNSSAGFGIFYWSINLGAFLFPMFLVPYLKSMSGHYVFMASAIATGLMIIPTLLFYKEPTDEKIEEAPLGEVISDIAKKIAMVFMDWRFMLFIFIYSWFWILYFQMFDSVLWYVRAFVDATPLNNFINSTFAVNWHFDVEHVTVINALTIIILQLLITVLVRKTKALPTMVVGILMATAGMAILAIDTSIWVFMTGITIFSIGEMTAHPKFIAYLGTIAPKDKKATYMGFGFLYGVLGSGIGGVLGAALYTGFVDNPMIAFIREKLAEVGSSALLAAEPTIEESIKVAASIGISKEEILAHGMTSELWLVFSSIGILCIIGLLAYQKFIGARSAEDVK